MGVPVLSIMLDTLPARLHLVQSMGLSCGSLRDPILPDRRQVLSLAFVQSPFTVVPLEPPSGCAPCLDFGSFGSLLIFVM